MADKASLRQLGNSNLSCFPIGFGAMGLSGMYGEADDTTSIALLNQALDRGINLFDSSDFYGIGHNEELLGKAFKDRRNEAIIATKFGFVQDPNQSEGIAINGSPEYVKQACEASLKRLGIDAIDLYYCHRLDPKVPFEETVGAMAELVKEGKVKHIGLCEVSANTLRKAHSIHPIAALQTEYSIWSRDIEEKILPACDELNISLVAYSPLGRGFLTGKLDKDNEGNETRSWMSERYSSENYDANMQLVKQIEDLASKKNASAAQVALAWLLHKSERVIPIPGTRKAHRMEENIGSTQITLDSSEMETLNQLSEQAVGSRYREDFQKMSEV